MTTQANVRDFLAQRTLAVVGASRSGKGFGSAAFRELKAKGYHLLPVHPQADQIEGERCYPSLKALPEPVGGVLIVVPPQQTEKVARDAAESGIRRIWIQQGAESDAALHFCQQQGLSVVAGECILMFAEPAGAFHRFHGWLWRLIGRAPK
jgi:predicted CoA-binding protein